jgi:hypothetical protein
MRIVNSGSGGTIFDFNWFLNYCDIKLIIQATEIEGKDDLLALLAMKLLGSLKIEVIPENEATIASKCR